MLDNDGRLTDWEAFDCKQNADGSFKVSTLGTRPLEDVVLGLRVGSRRMDWIGGKLEKSSRLLRRSSNHYEIMMTVTNATGPVGLSVGVSPDGREHTNIYWDPLNHYVVVNRSYSSLITEFQSTPDKGVFHPYRTVDGLEPIVWDVFLDGSLLEIYINGRFALTTRIYPSREDSAGVGLYVGEGAAAEVRERISLGQTSECLAWETGE